LRDQRAGEDRRGQDAGGPAEKLALHEECDRAEPGEDEAEIVSDGTKDDVGGIVGGAFEEAKRRRWPSVFMWPMAASMAERRRNSRFDADTVKFGTIGRRCRRPRLRARRQGDALGPEGLGRREPLRWRPRGGRLLCTSWKHRARNPSSFPEARSRHFSAAYKPAADAPCAKTPEF
jgi:hypothetical protein